MKAEDRSPSELLNAIGDILREREQKALPTYYTISIEQYEKITPIAEKEEGYENFKKQVQKYITDYELTAIHIQLFSGKSRNTKTPFQTFKVSLKKQSPPIVFGSTIEKEPVTEFQQLDSSIPVGRYYDEKFELQMRIMRTEMEKQSLVERVNQLTERYEDKIKDQEERHAEKLKVFEQEIESLEDQIGDFEKEIAKNEKEKHQSFGNIALGSISARAIENLAKSDIGTGVLKGLLGKDGYSTLQGHLSGIEQEQHSEQQNKPTARIIDSQATNDPRQITINAIQKTVQNLSDKHISMLYDIAQLAEKSPADLEVLWNVNQQIQNQRKQALPDQNDAEDEDEDETDEDAINQIP